MVSANLATYTPTFLPNLTKYLPPISAPDFFFSVYIKAFQCFKVGDLLKGDQENWRIITSCLSSPLHLMKQEQEQ